jgi:ABC-type branched-subunit amino acid transport system substrate-binding protein
MTADEGNGGANAANAAQQLLAQGAEIIVGPLFGPSVSAVAPIARDRGVPVLAFSTERSVAGNGVYLLSLPAAERSAASPVLCGFRRSSQFRRHGAPDALWRCGGKCLQ